MDTWYRYYYMHVYIAVQSQKAVVAYFTSKHILSFVFAEIQYTACRPT